MVARRVPLALLALLLTDVSSVNGFLTTTPPTSMARVTKSSSSSLEAQPSTDVSRREMFTLTVSSALMASTVLGSSLPALAKPEGVNKPELLPKEPGLNVIQVEKFLTSGQAKRMDQLLANLERDTGYRVRVLCQAYPNTPGLAIRDYWDLGKEGQKDDKYVVLVVDQFGGKGNALNFNVGDGVKIALPNSESITCVPTIKTTRSSWDE